jgi:hypothetical protein
VKTRIVKREKRAETEALREPTGGRGRNVKNIGP